MRTTWMTGAALCAALFATGCTGAMVEPGHRGLMFEPKAGVKPEVLQPGYHSLGFCWFVHCARVDDFDVTYSTRREEIHTTSAEGLSMDLRVAGVYPAVVHQPFQRATQSR